VQTARERSVVRAVADAAARVGSLDAVFDFVTRFFQTCNHRIGWVALEATKFATDITIETILRIFARSELCSAIVCFFLSPSGLRNGFITTVAATGFLGLACKADVQETRLEGIAQAAIACAALIATEHGRSRRTTRLPSNRLGAVLFFAERRRAAAGNSASERKRGKGETSEGLGNLHALTVTIKNQRLHSTWIRNDPESGSWRFHRKPYSLRFSAQTPHVVKTSTSARQGRRIILQVGVILRFAQDLRKISLETIPVERR
jgi:hypothetical protein